jgi:hypothetical protein
MIQSVLRKIMAIRQVKQSLLLHLTSFPIYAGYVRFSEWQDDCER